MLPCHADDGPGIRFGHHTHWHAFWPERSGAAAISNPGAQGDTTSDGANTARAWTIVPRVSLTETLTDNINLSSTDKQSGLISQLSPGVRIDARTARLKMYFDYALNAIVYSTGNNGNQAQNALNTFGTLEAIDNWLFLDFSGQISQQIINPFGQQSPSNVYDNRNTTETSTYRLSPYIRGQLLGSADYFLRYNTSVTNYQNSSLSDVTLSQWIGQIRGNTRFQNLNWTIDGSQQNTDYSRGRDYEDGRLRGVLIYRLFPEFRLRGSGGYESNNYQSINNEGQSTYGFGFDWTPTERSQASGFWEHRFFGTGHNVLLSHRFPLSSIHLYGHQGRFPNPESIHQRRIRYGLRPVFPAIRKSHSGSSRPRRLCKEFPESDWGCAKRPSGKQLCGQPSPGPARPATLDGPIR